MAEVLSQYGHIRLFDDFVGAEVPVEGTGAYAATTGRVISLGPFCVKGDLAETDTGAILIDKANGFLRVSGNDEDGKGVAVGTQIVFSPTLNGPLVLETRVEMTALTARVVWAGFCGTMADDVAEPLTATGTTLTLTAANLCGFVFDSQLTAVRWHMPYNGGTTTGVTLSTTVESDVTPVLAEVDVLRLEIDRSGTARWYINGVLKQTVSGAVSTTALQAGFIAVFGTTTTAASGDFDYLAVEAERDWTR